MKKTFDLTFRSKEKNKPIPAKNVYQTLSNIQDLMYSVAEMKVKLQSSKKGRKSDEMRNICELLITNVKPGSVTISLTSNKPQQNLFGYDKFGQNVLQDTGKIYSYVSTGDDKNIETIIPDNVYRTKIISKVQKTIPSEKSPVDLFINTINTGEFKTKRLAPDLLNKIIEHTSKLTEEDEITHQLVDIIGLAAIDKNGKLKKLENVYQMDSDINGLVLSRVKGKKYKYVFKKELFFQIEKSDDYITVQQSDLDIFSYYNINIDLKKALGEELDFLWSEYVEVDDKKLHTSGVELKNKILSLIYETEITNGSTTR